jgi:hypothetical protein
MDHQFMPHDVQPPAPSYSQTHHNPWTERTSVNSDSHGSETVPSWNLYTHYGQPRHSHQSVSLSPSNPSSPGSLYRYQAMSSAITPQVRENMETSRMELQQQRRGHSTQTWYPPRHAENYSSEPLPQIVSVSSLHAAYLNGTNAL